MVPPNLIELKIQFIFNSTNYPFVLFEVMTHY